MTFLRENKPYYFHIDENDRIFYRLKLKYLKSYRNDVLTNQSLIHFRHFKETWAENSWIEWRRYLLKII